uniref:D-aminoacyl-tRNA deacylase n=1 Tax=uncultured delta proteobacterium TaxID=34034 RepID=H5SLM3_9DELT|nr:D-tyrosyl-tRNA(Tyr) deacylase [uncultured delta proteobacterium]
MRAVVQRVAWARVTVDGNVIGAIGPGLLVYLGVGLNDDEHAVAYMADKVTGLRIFADAQGKMNLSVLDTRGGVLVVSQFTLYGDVRRGRRPAFDQAMEPARAEVLYNAFVAKIRSTGLTVATGAFRTHMIVESAVDGPVTILIDSSRLF